MAKRERQRRLPQLTTKAKIIVGLVTTFFIVIIVVLAITSTLVNQITGTNGETYNVQDIRQNLQTKTTSDRKTDAASEAYTAIKDGDTKKASDIYDQALSVETDPTAKVKLAIDQSQQLYRSGKVDDALTAAQKAESYSGDKFLIADWLSQLYAVKKDYGNAAKYYALAGSLVSSPTNMTGFTKSFYDAKVTKMKTLESQAK